MQDSRVRWAVVVVTLGPADINRYPQEACFTDLHHMNDKRIFRVGDKIGTPIHIIALPGTFDGDIEDEGSSVNNGAGHDAEDGDLCIDDNDGTLIAYRIPDLSGEPGTAIVGEQSFDLSNGKCFVLTADYAVVQIPNDDPDDAIANYKTT